MENRDNKIPETGLCAGTNWLIQINKLLPCLGIGAKSFNTEDLNKIIVKSLSLKAMLKYVGDGSGDLDNITDILDLMSRIDSKLSLTREVAALEQQQNKIKSRKQQSFQSEDKTKSTNGDSKSKGEL